MTDQGKRDKAGKMAVLSGWGNSMMGKLPADARRRLKRVADKIRRQAVRREIDEGMN